VCCNGFLYDLYCLTCHCGQPCGRYDVGIVHAHAASGTVHCGDDTGTYVYSCDAYGVPPVK
jgi:hypothetical protein